MASWRMSAVIIGLIACAVVGCVANECDTKMTAMRTFYTSDSECSGVIAVLDKQSACSDSDKTLLEKCLKVRSTPVYNISSAVANKKHCNVINSINT